MKNGVFYCLHRGCNFLEGRSNRIFQTHTWKWVCNNIDGKEGSLPPCNTIHLCSSLLKPAEHDFFSCRIQNRLSTTQLENVGLILISWATGHAGREETYNWERFFIKAWRAWMDISASGMMDVTFVNDLNTFTQEEKFTLTSTLHGEPKANNMEQKGLQGLKIKKSIWKQSMLLVPAP